MKAKIFLPEILIILVAAVLAGCFVQITVGHSGVPAKPGSPAYTSKDIESLRTGVL